MPATVTITSPRPDYWIVDVVETSTSDGETVTIDTTKDRKFPKAGRVFRIASSLTAGSATSIQPVLSTSPSDFSGPRVIAQTSANNNVDEAPEFPIPYGLVSDKLYHRSNPNIGSDNSITTRYLILDGWE